MKSLMTLWTACALLLASPSARPCGAFFSTIEATGLASGAQRALLVWGERNVDVHLQPMAQQADAPFAWVIPVEGVPGLSLGDSEVFGALDSLATPEVSLRRGHGGSSLCAGDAGVGEEVLDGGVTHFAGGVLGDYRFEVISAVRGRDAINWLTVNGYVVDGTLEPALDVYADLGMRFVVAQLEPMSDASEQALAPLVVSMERPPDRRLRFALAIASASAAELTPLVIYNLADKRYRVANYGSAEISAVADELRDRLDAGGDADYDAAVDALTQRAGGQLMVTEAAFDLGDVANVPGPVAALMGDEAFYLTRLYARIPRASLTDAIVTFANEAPDVSPTVVAAAPGHRGAASTLAGLLVAMAFLAGRRRRGGRPG